MLDPGRVSRSRLPGPGGVGGLTPARADRLELLGRQGARLEVGGVLWPALWLHRAHDGRVNARHGERETERGGRARLRRVPEEWIVEGAQAGPVRLVVRLRRLARVTPGGVCERALGDNAHLARSRQGQGEVERFLVRDAHRGLQRVEAPALDGVARRLAVAAVADVSRQAALARPLESADDVALAQLFARAAVELDQVEVIGGQALDAPLDAGEERLGPPVSPAPAAAMAALGEEVELAAPRGDGAADELLAVLVALGGVDDVEPGVEGAAQEAADSPAAHALVADLRAPEAQDAHHHVGAAEPASLHVSFPC